MASDVELAAAVYDTAREGCEWAGALLKRLRVETFTSLRETARLADIPAAELSRIEHGTQIPSTVTFEALLAVLQHPSQRSETGLGVSGADRHLRLVTDEQES